MTRWHPRLELARLLEALSEDIVAATDEEVRQLHGRSLASTAREVELLIRAARAEQANGVITGLDQTEAGPRSAAAPRRLLHHQRH